MRTHVCVASALVALSVGAVAGSRQGGTGAGAGRPIARSNAIVGRVVDPAGQPVEGTFVTALRPDARYALGYAPVSVLLSSVTNARGEFRLDGLNFGEYLVLALPHNRPADSSGRANRNGFANTFYPAATRGGAVQFVRVTPSGPATADIRLAPARLSLVSGTVAGAASQPIRGGTLGLTHGDGIFGLDSRRVVIRADGTFLAPGLQPGTYFFQFHEGAWPPPRGVIPKVSNAKVVVAGADVTNVRVVPITMVSARGRLLVDPVDRAALASSTVRIGATPVEVDGNPGPQQFGNVNEDLSFEFRTWPSVGRIRVEPRSWEVKAIRLNGVDVTDRPIEFVEGRVVSALEIQLVRRR